ncbi:MAG: SDR family oxidoreductase [Proteobacteria bacterium]|nr:SDR family oxidoreductase [Pseudomonadota bacterium]MCP4921348.1 SDR family oxidoreductase [Pseudomonadota bacterium]
MNVVLTGSGRGIGLELARQLHAAGHTVIAGCRNPGDELLALGVTVVQGVEVTSDEGIGRLLEASPDRVDLLLNNAGVLQRNTLAELDLDSIRLQFEVNALAPVRVTRAFLGRLERGSKVAIVTSRMGSIADNTSGGHYGYRMSKAAANMGGKSLANDLGPRGVAVVMLHPGFVKTAMTGFNGNWGPAEAAAGLLARIEELTPSTSGGFWHAEGPQLPW